MITFKISDLLWLIGVFVVSFIVSLGVRRFGYRIENGFTENERINILTVILAVLLTALVFVIRFVL